MIATSAPALLRREQQWIRAKTERSVEAALTTNRG
jgi:hypothetical protein